MESLRDRLITSASHYVLDMLEPLSPLWMVGLEIVKDGENLPECNFDENDFNFNLSFLFLFLFFFFFLIKLNKKKF